MQKNKSNDNASKLTKRTLLEKSKILQFIVRYYAHYRAF